MIGLAITVVYGLGYVLFLRLGFRFFRDDWGSVEDAHELGMIMVMAFLTAWFWPLTAIGLLFRFAAAGGSRDPEIIARKLGGESKDQKAERLEREREERERYISRLEADLGIGK